MNIIDGLRWDNFFMSIKKYSKNYRNYIIVLLQKGIPIKHSSKFNFLTLKFILFYFFQLNRSVMLLLDKETRENLMNTPLGGGDNLCFWQLDV